MKSNFVIDFELIKNLAISKAEAIVLDQIDYLNKHKNYPVLSCTITSLANVLQYSRTHLHRILKMLLDKELIYKENKKYYVSDEYRNIKEQCFINAHSNNKRLNKILKTASVKKISNIESSENDLLSFADIESKNLDSNIIDTKHINNPVSLDSNATSLSQNVTNLSHNVTDSILYNTKYSTKFINKLSRYIDDDFLQKGEGCGFDKNCDSLHDKALYWIESCFSDSFSDTNDLTNSTNSLISNMQSLSKYDIPKDLLPLIVDILQSDLDKANTINFREKVAMLESRGIDTMSVENNIKILNKTGLFLLYDMKVRFIENIESLNTEMIFKELRTFWNILANRIRIDKVNTRNEAIKYAIDRYSNEINEYIDFREAKGRYLNARAIQSLCLHIVDLESKGVDIARAIAQSIERDYNWIFPPTHKAKKRFYKNYRKQVA